MFCLYGSGEGSAGVVQNILKDNLDALRQVSKMISAETGCNIIICDSEGEIIEATLPERIGRKHMGSALILAGDSDEAVITPELEEKYTQLGTDTRRGYNYVITILGQRVGSLGISGEPEILKPIVRVAAKTIGFYISESLREKEKIQAQKALKKREDELEEVISILNSFWEHSPSPIGILDKRGKIIRVSKSVTGLLGYPAAGLEGQYLTKVFPPLIAYTLIRRIRKLQNRLEPLYFSDEVVLWDGSRRHYDSWVFPVLNSKEDSTLVGIVALDVTGRKRKEDRFKYLSQHDALTGLHNRAFFEEQLNIINNSNHYPLTFISLDADCLKLVNDTMGHDQGDLLLKNLAGIVKSSLREKDILARVGGDEFIVILLQTGREEAQKIAARVDYNINSYNQENPSLPISVSMGLYTVDEPGDSLEEVLKKTDELMYQNKTLQMANNRTRIINFLISSLAKKDFLDKGHGQRVAHICLKLAQRRGLPPQALSNLALLAEVHDLGLVGIPEEILLKPEPLTASEWEIIRQHPERGYRLAIASSSPELIENADLILKHHERWDGTGYPLGLKGEEIPLECRILALADAYDAIVSARPYRQARSKAEALEELQRNAGTQFDPTLVETFAELFKTGMV